MNTADGNRLIEALETGIVDCVMRGEIEWARELATQVAAVRDSMPTGDELVAAVESLFA